VYTFHLRDEVPWVKWDGEKVVKVQTCPDADGKTKDRMVTAQDFVYGTLRTLKLRPRPRTPTCCRSCLKAPKRSTPAGSPTQPRSASRRWMTGPGADLQGAGGIQRGDRRHVGRIRQPQWIIEGDDCTEARGERWTEPGFFQSYGPFSLKEWVHEASISIVKNPFWPGTETIPAPKLDEIQFSMLDSPAQLAEYEAGNLDIAPSPPMTDLDRLRADPKLSKELSINPQLCTYYYGFNTKAPVVNDARVRRALSMAIDRQGLVDNVTKGGQIPAQWFARPGLAGAPTPEEYRTWVSSSILSRPRQSWTAICRRRA